jgi:hypothetical protein
MNKFLATLSIILLLVSCGSSTTIVSSWRDPETTVASEAFKKVLVVALVKDEATRRVTENRITAIGPKFHSSFSILNGNNLGLTKEQKLKILKDENYDGVVTMRLVSTEKETTYVPGTNTSMYYGGMGAYGRYGYGFGNWYGAYSTNYYEPGYYQENTYYMVETNIFSLNSNKLIWTGTTKSSDMSDLGTTVDGIVQTLVKEMKKDGSLPKD